MAYELCLKDKNLMRAETARAKALWHMLWAMMMGLGE